MTKKKKKSGRPSKYSKKVAEKICEITATTTMGLKTICKENDDLPSHKTVTMWKLHDEKLNPEDDEEIGFSTLYARAKAAQMEVIEEDILDIADDGQNDWMERLGEDGKPIGWMLNGEHVQRSRLRVETRKWTMAKLAPKKYGDKITNELVGPDGKPISTAAPIINLIGMESKQKK